MVDLLVDAVLAVFCGIAVVIFMVGVVVTFGSLQDSFERWRDRRISR